MVKNVPAIYKYTKLWHFAIPSCSIKWLELVMWIIFRKTDKKLFLKFNFAYFANGKPPFAKRLIWNPWKYIKHHVSVINQKSNREIKNKFLPITIFKMSLTQSLNNFLPLFLIPNKKSIFFFIPLSLNRHKKNILCYEEKENPISAILFRKNDEILKVVYTRRFSHDKIIF